MAKIKSEVKSNTVEVSNKKVKATTQSDAPNSASHRINNNASPVNFIVRKKNHMYL